jgi:putative heme-binding domain-containing protein
MYLVQALNAKAQRCRGRKEFRALRVCIFAASRFFLTAPVVVFGDDAVDDRTRIAVEAVLKLQGVDLEQNAKLKETVSKLLAKTAGTAEFVRLVQHFKVPGQEEGLLGVAVRNPKSDFGVEAMRMVIASGRMDSVRRVIEAADIEAARNCVEAVGNSRTKEAPRLLASVVTDEGRDASVRRQAVKSLAQTQEGGRALLRLAEEQKVPDNLKFAAASELSIAPWPDIQSKAKELLPLPAAVNSEPLPPLVELVKRKGDRAKGEKVFNSPSAGCATCHQVNGQGIDFGPNLTEIGSKLAREALYESILDPNAGISFGYEAWSVELKSGDELYGLIVSDTPQEVAVKSVGGIVTKCRPGEIVRREKGKLSIMPAGLQQNMSTQDLVDLVEYLASLKSKKANPEVKQGR